MESDTFHGVRPTDSVRGATQLTGARKWQAQAGGATEMKTLIRGHPLTTYFAAVFALQQRYHVNALSDTNNTLLGSAVKAANASLASLAAVSRRGLIDRRAERETAQRYVDRLRATRRLEQLRAAPAGARR